MPTASPWTREDYDLAVQSLPESTGKFGVQSACVFNSLQSFHCIGQFPVDGLHDFLEKTGPCDSAAILFSLIGEGKFTLRQYNEMLYDIRLQGYENSDRPPQV